MKSGNDYEKLKLASFKSWDFYLHPEQYPYLGRAYLALKSGKRFDAWLASNEKNADLEELFDKLLPLWAKSCERAFGSELWPNLAFFANNWNITHTHFIPRWKGGLICFGALRFEDPHSNSLNKLDFPENNYSPYPKRALSDELLMRIKSKLEKEIKMQI